MGYLCLLSLGMLCSLNTKTVDDLSCFFLTINVAEVRSQRSGWNAQQILPHVLECRCFDNILIFVGALESLYQRFEKNYRHVSHSDHSHPVEMLVTIRVFRSSVSDLPFCLLFVKLNSEWSANFEVFFAVLPPNPPVLMSPRSPAQSFSHCQCGLARRKLLPLAESRCLRGSIFLLSGSADLCVSQPDSNGL